MLGSSNYHCKLVSPLLSSHGLEKSSGRARPLQELTGHPEFQCSVLAPYTFRLNPAHLETPGYGRDTSGSAAYLQHTLRAVTEVGTRSSITSQHTLRAVTEVGSRSSPAS